jgi:hypothetical protein
MAGGRQPYKKGAAHENLVARAYREAGFPVVVRSPASSSEYDLVAVRTEHAKVGKGLLGEPALEVGVSRTVVHLVQCKMGGYMRPAERESLKAIARQIGAVPVLAWGGNARKGTGPIFRKDIRNGRELASLDLDPDSAPTTDDTVVD